MAANTSFFDSRPTNLHIRAGRNYFLQWKHIL